MKDGLDEIKTEIKAKLQIWNNIKSTKLKLFLVVLGISLILLKIFTTVLTFDWLLELLDSI